MVGFEQGGPEIFPDPMTSTVEPIWESGVIKMLEQGNAAAVQAMASGS